MTSWRGNYYLVQVLADASARCRFLSEKERSWTPPCALASDQCEHVSSVRVRLCRSEGFGANDAHRRDVAASIASQTEAVKVTT